MNEEHELTPLDAFGRFLMEHLRDAVLTHYDDLARGLRRAPALKELSSYMASLGEQEQDLIRRCLIASLDSGIHDFLYHLVLETDNDGRVQVTVDGVNVVPLSDGLHGEPYTDRGWIAKYSAFEEYPRFD